MKKILAILLTIFLCATATAQMTNSIVIDGGSFRAVQTDALTGVNIDPIGLDHSRQACARVKIKFDRMTKEEIEALDVKMVSNTDLTKQKVAQYFDNVLILEMTAKPNTRFYVVHPNFGESNEVTLNLEGNREYEMLASLNQLYSIVVISNIPDVEILLDGNYKGVTDENCQLSVLDVTPGMHTLTYKFGSSTAQQNIAVHRKSIAFRQDVEMVVEATSKDYKIGDVVTINGVQGIVFQINPTVKVVSMVKCPHRWKYGKTFNGKISMFNGEINMKTVQRVKNWQKKFPAFKWCADLGEGWYIPAWYERSSIYKHREKIDSVLCLYQKDKLGKGDIGDHFFSSTEVCVDRAHDLGTGFPRSLCYGSIRVVCVIPRKLPTTYPPYKIGDYYCEDGKQGVVFEVSADGRHGKIVSMTHDNFMWGMRGTLIGADSNTDGAVNMAKVKSVPDWESEYPAFMWCADLGEGWYLPSKEELLKIYQNKDKLNPHLTDKLSNRWYWSSTESDKFCAWVVNMSYGNTGRNDKYYNGSYVRAVSAF